MKKILSLLLVGIMVVSMIPTAFATTDVSNGTQVSYNAEADNDGDGNPDHTEAYTVTVPAQLAPGGSGDVVASGTWASNRKLNVTADANVTLTNSINAADKKVLDVTFPCIALVGSNTAAVTDTKVVSVADISNALFGTWEGHFEYNVEMVDAIETLTQAIYYMGEGEPGSVFTTIEYEPGMTWEDWINSAYNTIGLHIVDNGNFRDIYTEDDQYYLYDFDYLGGSSPEEEITQELTYTLMPN